MEAGMKRRCIMEKTCRTCTRFRLGEKLHYLTEQPISRSIWRKCVAGNIVHASIRHCWQYTENPIIRRK